MPHVVSVPPAPYRARDDSFTVHTVPAADDNLSFLLVCTRTGSTAVVDGPDADVVLAYARAHDLRITHVLNTHVHGDHVGLNRGLVAALPGLQVVGPAAARGAVPCITRAVDEGDEVEVGALRGRVLRTDGHLLGHVSYVFGEALFPGDTLFTCGSGRVFSGDYTAMQGSLARLRALPPDTRVFCAHEYTLDNLAYALSLEPHNEALAARAARTREARARGETVVPGLLAEELATNPMLRWDAQELVASVAAAWAGTRGLNTPVEIYRATRELKDRGDYRRR
jgi:hydroxyacylglutathione hydrolase